MLRASAKFFAVTALIGVPAAMLLLPAPTGACSPCGFLESGERWELVPESWTIDGADASVPESDAGLFIANPGPSGQQYGSSPVERTDPFLDAQLLDSDGGAFHHSFRQQGDPR